jgi:PAS domain-containing protein
MKKNTSLSNKDRGHFFSIFENEPLGVAQTASDDHLLMVNGTLCRMLGYQRRDLLQKTFKELTHPDDRSREAEIIDELVRGTETSYEIEKPLPASLWFFCVGEGDFLSRKGRRWVIPPSDLCHSGRPR